MTSADRARLDLPSGDWVFCELVANDNRGMGYVEADGKDILHVGEQSLWANQNRAIGHLSAAAPDLYEALQLLHDNIAEYARINNLGGFDNHDMKMAREALAKSRG